MSVPALVGPGVLRALIIGVLAFLSASCATAPAAIALSDARGYEVVSPADKNGGDTAGDGETVVASRDGNAVAYASRVAFGDTSGSGIAGLTQYVARRSESGWTTKAITPTPDSGTFQVLGFVTVIPWFSDDLTSALVFAYDLPQVSNDTPKVPNVYLEHTPTGELTPLSVSQADPLFLFTFLSAAPWAASADLGHVALVSFSRLLPEAPTGAPSVYDWANGRLRLASVLPDGSAAPGADVQPRPYRSAVSADGSRLVFVSPGFGASQIYVRIDGARTEWVTQPEASADPGTPADVSLQYVTDDGRHIVFSTTSRLLDGDTNDGPDLYRWDETPNPETDSNLTLVSDTGDVPGQSDGTAVIGANTDASRIYYQDQENRVWLWDHGRRILVSGDVQRSVTGVHTRISATDADPGAARVTPDGSYLAFLTNATQNNDQVHGLTGGITNNHVEMYVYDAQRNTLTCASCPQGGDATADATVVPSATVATTTLFLSGARPRYLSSNGRVFFSTPESLMPEDTNGVTDVYEYDPATRTLVLVSSGKGSNGAWFADASESGDNVFFATRQRLVPQDRDSLVDLYDARVGGGFPAPPVLPAACAGDACQGASATAPGEPSIASESLFGSRSSAAKRSSVSVRGSRVVRGDRATLLLRLSSSGRVTWAGRGLRRGERAVSAGHSYVLHVLLAARARRLLKRGTTYRTTLTLRFAPSGGTASAVKTRLTFKPTLSRKGR